MNTANAITDAITQLNALAHEFTPGSYVSKENAIRMARDISGIVERLKALREKIRMEKHARGLN